MNRLIVGCLMIAVCAGCSSSDPAADSSSADGMAEYNGSYPINAIATVGMVADIVRNVGGDHVNVSQLMGAGVDPHLYKATRDDVLSIMDSDIVFYSGLMLEGKMADTFIRVGRSKPVYAVTELIDETDLLEPEEMEGHHDPHVWMDVSAWSKCVDAVAQSLGEFDPSHADDYAKNARAYQQQLTQLHAYGVKSIGSIPTGKRVLVTSHDAFNYFGRAYGLDVMGVQGISTESEAGLKRIVELVDMLVTRDVRAVFVESSVSRKSIESLLEGAAARDHSVVVGGELFSDAMGPAGTYEGTYIGMLDHNITLVTRALGGDAPAGGMQGKLTSHDISPAQ
ncbi:MAG: zinc ABC transporter substrate-binding protein [Pirellulales bacterium]|nr:zinc ABC transporter substrate-binding protein [Pirellulales bacterium]